MVHMLVSKQVELELRECPRCGAFVALTPDQWKRREDGRDNDLEARGYTCPNGHTYGWWESEADRLRKQLTAAQESNNSLVSQRRQLELERDIAERKLKDSEATKVRLIKRVNAGVCPHCHRTVSQLARHIKTKHGDMPTLVRESEKRV